MTTLWQSFLLFLGAATDKELAQQVQYLKVENEILRQKLPQRITVTAREKQRLIKYGKVVGAAIQHLITIVSPRTFARWLLGETAPREQSTAKVGRPRTPGEIEELVLRLARENSWGYTRILGELKKLGVKISRSTVINILKAAGIDTSPDRSRGSWADFIQRHAATLWACDFFTKIIWTLGGPVDYFVLFFLCLGSRRVYVTGMTANPDGPWMVQQARNFHILAGEQAEAPAFLIRDLDTKFTKEFDALLAAEGIEVIPVGPAAPNLNAHAERFVKSIKEECLNSFCVFGEAHLRYLINQYLKYYNEFRPHQGVGNVPLTATAAESATAAETGTVVFQEWLGGHLKHYFRRAG